MKKRGVIETISEEMNAIESAGQTSVKKGKEKTSVVMELQEAVVMARSLTGSSIDK
jgi:hypothetical protein